MSNTYSQIYIHVVFAVKGRNSLINPFWEESLYKYITGIVTNKNQKMLCINGNGDHIHFLIGMQPSCCLSDLVREIKKSTNQFINENHFCKVTFTWQEGFGAFSHSRSQKSRIIAYIQNQKKHHLKQTFREEYVDFMKKFEIDYKEDYLFDWID